MNLEDEIFLGQSVAEVGFLKELPILWKHEFTCLNCLRSWRIEIEQYIVQNYGRTEREGSTHAATVKQKVSPCLRLMSDFCFRSASPGFDRQFARQIQGVLFAISREHSKLLYPQNTFTSSLLKIIQEFASHSNIIK